MKKKLEWLNNNGFHIDERISGWTNGIFIFSKEFVEQIYSEKILEDAYANFLKSRIVKLDSFNHY